MMHIRYAPFLAICVCENANFSPASGELAPPAGRLRRAPSQVRPPSKVRCDVGLGPLTMAEAVIYMYSMGTNET